MPLAVLPSCLWVWELGLVHQVPDWPCLQTFPGVNELTSLEAHTLAVGGASASSHTSKVGVEMVNMQMGRGGVSQAPCYCWATGASSLSWQPPSILSVWSVWL